MTDSNEQVRTQQEDFFQGISDALVIPTEGKPLLGYSRWIVPCPDELTWEDYPAAITNFQDWLDGWTRCNTVNITAASTPPSTSGATGATSPAPASPSSVVNMPLDATSVTEVAATSPRAASTAATTLVTPNVPASNALASSSLEETLNLLASSLPGSDPAEDEKNLLPKIFEADVSSFQPSTSEMAEPGDAPATSDTKEPNRFGKAALRRRPKASDEMASDTP